MEDTFADLLVGAIQQNGGVTADITAGRLTPARDAWLLPRYPALTRIVPLAGLRASVVDFIETHKSVFDGDLVQFGGWINPVGRRCYLDLIVQAESQAEAERLAGRYGREGGRRIEAIHNPALGRTVRLADDL
ncbi:hypothetical protein [Kribbella sp. NPDC051620]|uniref:hypothetical protein n=1 Tax=Kribbella sp. NPDC051620 TaxID=3364120 RepID=UPI00379C04B3